MKILIPTLLGLLLLGATPGTSQTPPPAPDQPTFQTQVELVTVDVAVVDRKGLSVRGLTRDDFVVTENDVPQTLTSFEAVAVPEAPRAADTAPRRTSVSTNVVPDNRRGRTFAVGRRHPPLAGAGPARPRRRRRLPPGRGGGTGTW